jgi:hypothetical protein
VRFVVINKDPRFPIYLIDELEQDKLGISHIKVIDAGGRNKVTQICMANGENILVNRSVPELLQELWPGAHEFNFILTPLPKIKKAADDSGNKKGQ